MNERWQLPERHIWALVCGLPNKRARAKRLLMTRVRVFIDDSGKADHSPVMVLAGYLASAENWAAFTNEWQAILDEHGIGGPFHMTEAWRLGYRYQSRGKLSRDAAIVRLTSCIRKHVEHAFVSSINLDAHRHWFAVDEAPKAKPLRPYFYNFYAIMTMVYHYALNSRFGDRVEVIFDEQGGESQQYILSAMDEYRATASIDFPDLVIPTPTFQRDHDVLPLQAADLLAWLVRRDAVNAFNKRDRSALPEAMLLGEALSMPNQILLWDDEKLEAAAKDAAARFSAAFPSKLS